MKQVVVFISAVVMLTACGKSSHNADAYGNFEAVEIMVSAENPGKITGVTVDEGATLNMGEVIAQVDTMQLHFKRLQLTAANQLLAAKKAAVFAELAVAREELNVATIEKERIVKLLKDEAATVKQFDDISGRLSVLSQKNKAIAVQLKAFDAEAISLDAQLGAVVDLIQKSTVTAPVNGTILQQYAEVGEMISTGKSIVKMADLSVLELKVYVAGDQLAQFKIGGQVNVTIDQPKGKMKDFTGTISRISDKAEFTPKIIQTKAERVDMVYAVVIRVKNSGELKIGMPAEVRL